MTSPLAILSACLLLSIAGLGFVSPIPQDSVYHAYADTRTIFGIPYFWNVVSNLPMLFIGAYGIRQALRYWQQRPEGVARWIPLVLSAGVFMIGFGSGYYHWVPKNDTLLWDRLPMTLMFMSLFSLLIYDYVGKRAGTNTFWIALPLGVASVLFWHFTEAAGHGDLRPYALVQFFPMLAIVVLLLDFRKKVPYVRPLLFVLGWYVVAKMCEHYDHEIYRQLGFWSGHTLKHLFASVALVYVMKIVDGWLK
jgi:Ceramidase